MAPEATANHYDARSGCLVATTTYDAGKVHRLGHDRCGDEPPTVGVSLMVALIAERLNLVFVARDSPNRGCRANA